MVIKSPYNFVPLSDTVILPDWANQVSHDVPFSDGKSGVIEVELKAETPIFIRNGSKTEETEFSHFLDKDMNKKYFIPGSSLKGMIRSVIEIFSFGKMNRIDDRRFSRRELNNQEYSSKFVRDFNSEPLVKAGFISKEDDCYVLYPCSYARIEQPDLDKKLKNDKHFGMNSLLSAVKKYTAWSNAGMKLTQSFNITEPKTDVFIKQCGKFRRATFSTGNDEIEGQLVFTGQIKQKDSFAEGMHGIGKKHLEFVFYEKIQEGKKIPKKMWKDFVLNHSDDRNRANHKNALSPNEEWAFWKKKLEGGDKMPVFWLGETKIESFGLSMLYRLPYKYSTHDLLRQTSEKHLSEKPDMGELLFGYVREDSKECLKGRVHFSHALCITQDPKAMSPVILTLSSPKPTFWPFYLTKSGNYDLEKNTLAGRKRYPVLANNLIPINTGTCKTATSFKALPVGTTFQFRIRYHNLKEVELGALLSAITLNDRGNSYHNLGMAKSFGFGRTALTIQAKTKHTGMGDVVNKYIEYIEAGINSSWADSIPVREFFAMAYPDDMKKNESPYMQLEEFTTLRDGRNSLTPYSENPEHSWPLDELKKLMESCTSEKKLMELYSKFSKNNDFRNLVIDYLKNKDYIPELKTVYEENKAVPELLLTYLRNKARDKNSLRRILGTVERTSYEKSNSAVQDIFRYILTTKYNGIYPVNEMTNIEKNFEFSWEDMNLDEDKLLDLFSKIEKEIAPDYPPYNDDSLLDYVNEKWGEEMVEYLKMALGIS